MDANYVPKEGRKAFIRLEEYYKLANGTNVTNVDFSGQGSIAEGKVVKVAGIELIPTAHFVSSNVTAAPDARFSNCGWFKPSSC